VADRIPCHCIIPLRDGFKVRLTLPLGVHPEEARKLKSIVDDYTLTPKAEPKPEAAA
jgi:hypothetical protein